MKKVLRIIGITSLALLGIIYLSFLLILPNVVDLNQFKPLVQNIAKEQAQLEVDFSDIKITTTPILTAGVVLSDLSVKMPDKSELFSANSIKARISLPSLLLLTVRVSDAEIISPRINLDIENGEQYKIVRLVENIVNAQKEDFSKVKSESKPMPFDPSIIKIVVPAFTLKDYKLSINDAKNKQNMFLEGTEFVAGYFNGKKARVKTDAKLLVDGKTKINANVALSTFIPTMPPALDEDDDPTQRLEIPFVNPIDIYKTYDLTTNVDAKIRVRDSANGVLLGGFLNAENISMTLSGYKLPESYARLKFLGSKILVDSDLYVNPNAHLQTIGKIGYGKRPFVNLQFVTSKIYYNDLIVFAKAVLDTFNVPNNLANMKGHGYFVADTKFRTNFRNLKSVGYVLIKDAGLSDKKAGLLIKDANVVISLDNNALNIKKAAVDVNGAKLTAKGAISEKAVSDLQLYTSGLSLKELYNVFAPNSLKNQLALNSGILSLDAKLQGELKKARAIVNVGLKNLSVNDRKNTFALTNEDLDIKLDTVFPSLDGAIVNKNFRFNFPATQSSLYAPLLVLTMDETDINIMRSGVKLNNSSVINFHGDVFNYSKNPNINFVASGKLAAADLKMLAGDAVAFFIDGKGSMPVKFLAKGTLKKLALVGQVMTDADNYFTPVTFEKLKNKQNILQAHIDYKGNRIKIKDTGIYTKNEPTLFSDNLELNVANSKQQLSVASTVALGVNPYINLFKLSIPKALNGTIYALPESKFVLDKTMLFAFGEATAPKIRGIFRVADLDIPSLFIKLKEASVDLRERRLYFNLADLLVNGSDFNVNGYVNMDSLPIVSIPVLNVVSNNVDVAKLTAVAEAAAKVVPSSTPTQASSQPADLPIVLGNGSINFKRIDASPVIAENTTGRISIRDNIFYLDNLKTYSLGGQINGQVNLHLLNMLLGVKVKGQNFDVEKALLVLANMKDTLAGTASFETDITMNAAAPNQIEQMRSLSGNVDFSIIDGQLGPFGKIENLILAENIRNSKFFQTTIGSVISSVVTIESSHFQNLDGHLEFSDGIVDIKPITSIGKVLCIHIAGNMNLLTNDATMKLRARMGSQFANMLGPLAAVNPINLVKVTPGLNVMAAQAFQFFCESISQEEMDALPNFKEDFSAMSTTKFQVVIDGNTAKPLSMIKSFKWLALDTEIAAAQDFVSTLPDPSIVADPENATYEQIMQAKAELEALQAKEAAKPINRIKRFLGIDKNEM